MLIRGSRAAAAVGAVLALAGCIGSPATDRTAAPGIEETAAVAAPPPAGSTRPDRPPAEANGSSGDWVDFDIAPDNPAQDRSGTPTGADYGISLACPEGDAAQDWACGPDPHAPIPIGPEMDGPRARPDELYLQLYSTRLAGDIEMSVQAKSRAALRWVLPFAP